MEDYVLNTFKALKSKVSGFDKTEQQFRDLVTNDPAYRANVHKALTEKVDGFSRTSEEFDSLVGVKKKDISGSGDPALQSFEAQTPSQSTVSGEINVGDVPQVPVSKTPQVPGTGEIKEGVLTQPPKPKSPEELNLEMQSKVLGKDIPKDLVETAKITTDKSQLHNEAYALLKNNKTAAANAVSDIILQKFPDDSYAHQIKAYNFEVEKDYVNSAKELTQAIEKSPDDKSLYAKRALVARSAGMETTAKEDAQAYLRLAKLPNGDEDEALTRSNMYMLAGDEKQAQYWKKNYEGLVQDRHRGNTAQNLIGLHDWVLSGIDKISKPLQIPGDMIVEGVRKVAEGWNEDSMPKRISGLIDAGFGVLMATPAGVVFNSAITAGELVGAGEVTEWAFAPISKALNLAGIDEKQVGSILKAGLSPTAPISEKTANAWGDLAVQIGNLLPFMLFSHGTKYAKTADKLTKREPLDATDLKNVDEVIASSAENPQSMNEPVKLAEQFIKDKKDEKEVSDVQKSMGAIPTYRIGSKLYPTPESFLKRLQDIKDKGVENINYEINLDPETSGKALDIFREKNTPTEPGPSEISDGVQQIKANDLKNEEEIKVDALKEPEQPPTLTEPTANVDKGSGIGEPAPIVPESISTPSQELPVNEKTGENLNQTIVEPIEFSKQLEQKHGVTVDLLGTLNSDRPLTLSKIEVPKETRMSGIGTAVMREIIDYADANDKKIVLTPSKDYGATSISRLKKFYKQFGFVENTGKNKDFSTKESMYRQPQPSGSGSQNVNPAIPTSKTGRKEVLSEQPQEGTTGAKSNPAVFTTPKGISIHNDKGLLVMFDKSGKEIPQVDRTVKKEIIVNGKKKITTTKFYNKQYREAKKEYLNGIEFDNGKEIDYFPDISESEADRFVLENTENPQHVLGVYERASMQNQAEKFGSMEWHIAEHLRFVTKESFDRWMSQNAYKDREDGLIQKVYFRSPKGKEQTQTLDQVAQSASAGFHGSVDNVERITPEMVGQFIIDYPGGTDKYYSAKSEIMTSAERKFTELTGLKIDKDLLQIAKNKLEAKRERNEWEKKHLRNVSPELRKTLDDPITLESLPLYREIFNKEEYKLIEEALKNEKINQGTEERPGGEESSQPIAMGEKSNTGILEQERQSRLAEIDSEIKRLNIEKKNESDRIDKENANIELPLDTPKQGELLNAEPKPIITDLSEYDSKIRALENERNTLISKEKQVAEADKAQGDLLKPTIAESFKSAADRLRENKINKRLDDPTTLGVTGVDMYNKAIDIAADIIERTGDFVQALADGLAYLKNTTKEDRDKFKALIEGLQPEIKEPEGTSLKRAVADNEKSKREGVSAVDNMVSQLQDTSVSNIMDEAKSLVDSGSKDAKLITKEIIRTKKGTATDEGILLYDRAKMRNREIDLMNQISKAQGKERDSLSAELLKLYSDMADNDLASATIGREASTIFRLRQAYIDSEYSLYSMEREFSASHGVEELSGEQKQYVQKQYQDLKAAEAKVRELEQNLASERQKLKDQELINAIRRENDKGRGYKPEFKNAKKRFNSLADKIEQSLIFEESPNMLDAPISFGMNFDVKAWNDAVREVSKTIRAVGDVAQAIVKGLEKIRSTDWYKGLTDEYKARAEKKFTDTIKSTYSETDRALKTDKKQTENEGVADGEIKVPVKLVKQFVADGIDNIEDLTQAVKNELKDQYPNATDRQIRDAITNYGKLLNMSKEEVDVQLRKIRRMGKLVSGMEDVESGKRPLRSGLQRDKPDVEERNKRKELNDLLKELPMDQADLEKYQKSALDGIKTRLNNRIEELQHEIDTGQKKIANKRNIPLDAEAESLIKQRDELQKLRDEIFGKTELTDQQRIDLAMNGIIRAQKEVDRRISENDIESKNKKRVSSPELDLAREELRARRDILKQMRDYAGILKREYNERLLKAIKTRQDKLQNKIDTRDFSKPIKIERERTKEVDDAIAEYKKLQLKWKLEQQKEMLKNRTGFEKFVDKSIKVWTGIGLLSGIKTLAKLAHYTGMEVFYGEPMDILTTGVTKILLPGFAKKSMTEGHIDWKSRKEFYKTLVSKQTYKEALGYAKERDSYIDNLYGDITKRLPDEFTLNFGKLHGVEKYPLRKADFNKNFIRIENWYRREGYDTSDPAIRKTIGAMAYAKANYRIMMNKNFLSTTLRAMQQGMLNNKSAPTLGKIGYYTSKVMFPIISVPTNYTIRTARAWGGLAEFGVRVLKDGYKNMTPEQTESALLAFKNGLPGIAIGLLVFNSNFIHVDDKDDLVIGGWKVPRYLTHHPHILAAKLFAEAKKEFNKKGLYNAVATVPIETMQETPYLSERTLGVLDSPTKLKTYMQNIIISWTQPQLLKDISSFMDKDAAERNPKTFMEKIKMGIPWLRHDVPTKKSSYRPSVHR